MELVRAEHKDGIAILKLNKGVINALDLQFVDELGDSVCRARDDSDVYGIVLTGSNNKFFSMGFDIPQLLGFTRKNLEVFYRTFNRVCMDLYTLSKPTVAAITGHAVAGGCILALCCDYRFIAEGKRLMGLNEIRLGLPVPYPGECILKQVVGERYAREIMYTGEFYRPEKSFRLGLVDRVLPVKKVLSMSINKAESIGVLSHEAFGMIKHNRVETVEAQIRKHLTQREKFYLDCWFSERAHELLTEMAKKF